MRRRVGWSLLLVPALAVACAGRDGDRSVTLTVLAASSLTDVLVPIDDAFEAAHPDVHIRVTYGSSAALAAQILEGVPADAFLSAGEDSLAAVVDGGLATGRGSSFASNRLAIAFAPGNPLAIRGLADLADVRLALCVEEAPCGTYGREAFERAGIPVPASSDEDSVRGVLTKVALGEADAGIVYVTDLDATDDVDGVVLPDEQQVIARYDAVALQGSPHPGVVGKYVEWLQGPDARAILTEHGFGTP